jgi:hypothetical protein
MNKLEAVNNLGRRVVLVESVAGVPRGRTGLLISLQSGCQEGSRGPERVEPYATVAFDLADLSDEENVPLQALRPFSHRM